MDIGPNGIQQIHGLYLVQQLLIFSFLLNRNSKLMVKSTFIHNSNITSLSFFQLNHDFNIIFEPGLQILTLHALVQCYIVSSFFHMVIFLAYTYVLLYFPSGLFIG